MFAPFAPTALRRPPPLRRGDAICFVAPAGAYDAAAAARGQALIEAVGLRCRWRVPPRAHHVYAGDDDARLAALHAALDDDDVAALWTVRGGSGSARLLPRLDVALQRQLRARPRWLVGFSDVTALHARVQAAGLQSLHAANLVNLADWSADARAALWQALGLGVADRAPVQRHVVRPLNQAIPAGLGGVVVGGNLTVLASVVGCGVLPPLAGSVLFVEDVAEAPYRIDRALAQLVHSGALRGVRAVVLGQFTRCGAAATLQAMICATLAPLGLPVVAGLGVGHEASSQPLLLGGWAEFTPGPAGTSTLTVHPGPGPGRTG